LPGLSPSSSFSDCCLARVSSSVSHARQFLAIPLPTDNRPNDPHPSQACNVSDDVMELQIHLHHRFLHVLDMRGAIFDQHLTVSQLAAQSDNLAHRPKRSWQ